MNHTYAEEEARKKSDLWWVARAQESAVARGTPDSVAVRHPFYAAKCNACGYTNSSEAFDEARGYDDADMVCPKCGSPNTGPAGSRVREMPSPAARPEAGHG